MGKRAAVIGGGLGGLSAAISLRDKGLEVDLFEKNSFTGGKAGAASFGGFTFDTGPSLLTMPFVFEKLIKKCGKDPLQELPVKQLDIICKYFFNDGTIFNAYSDRDKLLDEFDAKTDDPGERVQGFFQYCENIYNNAKDMFLFDTLENVPGIFKKDPLKGLSIFANLDIFRTLHRSHEVFFRDPNTIQLFDRYATYSGSDPFKLAATLNIIPHVEYSIGAFVPERGIRAIPEVLTAAAAGSGVRIYTGSKVDNILLEGKRVTGIEVSGNKLKYDMVLSNADVKTTYKELLKDTSSRMSKRYLSSEPSSSAIVFYWAVNDDLEELEANNIFFSGDYRTEFAQIFDKKVCPEDPTVYVNISSKYYPHDAPPGCGNWFVLVNVPHDLGQDWRSETGKVRTRVLRRLNRALGKDIGPKISAEEVMTPEDIYRNTYSNRGSIYGISSNSRMAAYYRQPNRSDLYNGLYFSGGSAHPGGGMPLVALSGMIASELAEKHELNKAN